MTGFGRRRAAHLRLGRRGEHLAAWYLREAGLDILGINVRFGKAELDIVAREGCTLCFVEVKTRSRYVSHDLPASAVGSYKKRLLVQAATEYLRALGNPLIPFRFDVVEIVLRGWRIPYAAYHRAAF